MGSNPFVNPNQRGVELPPGCKDLMDVLKLGGSERPGVGWSATITTPAISSGKLSDVEPRVETFLESGAGEQLFSVGIQGGGLHVILLKRGENLSLNFSVPPKQQSVKDAARRIFQNPKIGQNMGGMEYVSVALNSAKDAVARMIVELLMEGLGVLEGEQLMFCSCERMGE
jgi:hypothetical protein